jgi:hypothetical protein
MATVLGQALTVKQEVEKLKVVGEHLVLGVSGPVGLMQSYQLELERKLKATNNRVNWRDKLDARSSLQRLLWPHAEEAWKRAGTVAATAGPGAAMQAAAHQSVVAFPIADEACLVQLDHQCQPEEASRDLPFVSIGSGQVLADPFLAFIRRVFWPLQLPSLHDGILAAVWTIQHAIRTQPGGVAEPIQIVSLCKDKDGNWTAQQLSRDEVDGHRLMIRAIEDKMQQFRKEVFQEQPTEPIP